jgi:hypothetical protein
MIAV